MSKANNIRINILKQNIDTANKIIVLLAEKITLLQKKLNEKDVLIMEQQEQIDALENKIYEIK